MLIFQSTFPRGERPNRHMLISSIINFNPRSRVGNDLFCLSYNFNCIISIHVPAWGTTFVTLSISVIRIFQSTFPRGERHISIYRDYPGTSISIHVPAWGTTRQYRLLELRYYQFQSTFPRGERRLSIAIFLHKKNFNPRSRVGNDKLFIPYPSPHGRFQSTFPRGERLSSCL